MAARAPLSEKAAPRHATSLVRPFPMRWTLFPRYFPDLQATDAEPRRYWLIHVPLMLAIMGLFALPQVEAWIGVDLRVFLVLVALHLVCFAAEVHLGLYQRSPTVWTTVGVTLNFTAAMTIALLPGRMMAPLFSFYGLYVLYLTRAAPASLYVTALIAGGPLLGVVFWTGEGAAAIWPPLAVVSMAGTTLYLTLVSFGEQQRKLHAELETARVRERIAADLHDSVGTALAEVALWHDIATIEKRDEAEIALDRARRRTGEALLELRMAVSAMTAGDIGAMQLAALLRARVEALCDAVGARARIEIEASSLRLTGEDAHHLSNLISEAVANAARHGRPKSIELKLCFSPLFLSVHDDGKGFDASSARRGHGLASMRARASALSATLKVSSSPSSGTTVEVRSSRSAINARAATRP